MACYVLTFDGIAEKIRIPSSSDKFELETFAKDLQKLAAEETYEIEELKEKTTDPVTVPKTEDVLFYSGGAEGADSMWNEIAREYGYKVLNYYTDDYTHLSQKEIQDIEGQYQEVRKEIGRNGLDANTYAGKLVRRDMLQANSADSIIAIATIQPDSYRVDGGTAYAVFRGIHRGIPVYVYDLNRDQWTIFDKSSNKFIKYDEIPLLTPHAALIGTRSLSKSENIEHGKEIIRQVFDNFVSEKSHLVKAIDQNQEEQIDFDLSKDLVITNNASTTAQTAQLINGIDTLRHPDSNGMHFGNPFSHQKYKGVQVVVPTVKDAVIAFEQWLRGENYQDVEPDRRQWILNQINSGSLNGKQLVYYTKNVPDNSYGRKTYDYIEAPNHAHILMKLIEEKKNPSISSTNQAIIHNDWGTIDKTIETLESNNNELSTSEKKSIKSIIGDSKPRVLVASEHTDPVFHAKKIKELVKSELAKDPKDRQFHMMYIITKHDGLPLKELAQLKIPKFFHFSITSLGGTPYEPGVMKPDHLLDRISAFIADGSINPSLCTIRIDPIIPGVTKEEDVRHIIERGLAMGIKQYKFSVMDSYGYTSSGERCETEQDRFIIKKMESLGYNWDKYYGRNSDGTVNFNAKREYINHWYQYMDNLAEELKFFVNTCGEAAAHINGLKHIKTLGCVNVESMNAAMGTSDITQINGAQRQNCSCYGNKIDALRYDDTCASSCLYCYAKHNSDRALQYYNADGSLKINRFTEVVSPESLALIPNKDIVSNRSYFINDKTYSYFQFETDLRNWIKFVDDRTINDSVPQYKILPEDLGTFILDEDIERFIQQGYFDSVISEDDPIEIQIKNVKEAIYNEKIKFYSLYDFEHIFLNAENAPSHLIKLNDMSDEFWEITNELEDNGLKDTIDESLYNFSSLYLQSEDDENTIYSIGKSILNKSRNLLGIEQLFIGYTDPTQLQFAFDEDQNMTSVKMPENKSEDKTNEIEKEKHSYSSSETVNKISRYLEYTLNQQTSETPLQEIDVKEALNIVAKQMENLGITVHLLDSDEQMEEQGFPANTEASVKNGEIYVNLKRAKVSSPMHEFMHLVFAVMKQENFDQFANLMSQLRGIKEFDEILNQVQQSEYYSNLIESDQLEEAFVRYLSGLLDGEINTSDEFELFYNENQSILNNAIQKTFGTPKINDLINFLKQPFANITKYGSELFVKRNQKTTGYSDKKYNVDITGRIMSFIQSNMGELIQEGECK